MFTDARPAASKREIKALTSLRGIAALAVVAQHFSATAQSHSSGWIPSLAPHGYMAVDFFFVLSGFIMSYTYLSAFQSQGMAAYGPFLWKRIARIFPLGLVMLAAILILGGIASIWGRSDLFINQNAVKVGLAQSIIVNALHLQGFWFRYNLNDPSWSISVELVAYALFPVLIHAVFNPRWIVPIAVISAGAAAIAAVAIGQPGLSLGIRSVPTDLGRCVIQFAFGMLVYRVFRTHELAAIGSDAWTFGVSAICVAMFAAGLDLAVLLSFPFVILAWARNAGAASRLLSMRIPYFLGTISFSIYLTHHLFRRPELEIMRHFFEAPVAPAAAIAFAIVGTFSIIPFAALAYYFVERPGRDTFNSLLRRAGPRRVSAPAA